MEPRKKPDMPDTDAMRRIRELADKIVVEKDVEKFQELVREMNELWKNAANQIVHSPLIQVTTLTG